MPKCKSRKPGPAGILIPRVITHRNRGPIMAHVGGLECMQPGAGPKAPRPEWLDQEVILEVPLGEICRDGLVTLALCGRSKPEPMRLTGKEGFAAQGLEGKVQIRKPLLAALFNLDLLPEHRGRILTKLED